MANIKKYISEWKSVSELRPVEQDISGFGYSKEFIDANKLNDKKSFHCSNMITGVVNFFEPLEVKEENGVVYYRENENPIYIEIPEAFATQFGTFNNHNHGEFASWLGKDDYDGLSEKEKETNKLLGRSDFFIDGNFCDMFDCGGYSYAISNLMHMGLGIFKIVRIDKNLKAVTIYDNYSEVGRTCLEYAGRLKNEQGYIIIASGTIEFERKDDKKREFQDTTLLFQIDENGNCRIRNKWNIALSSSNSIVKVGDFAYLGQNKMVTRLNISSGEIAYFTNKNGEELSALKKMW